MPNSEVLRAVSLFAGVDDRALERLADALGRRSLERGAIVFDEDSVGDALFIIESGRVAIFLVSESGQETVLAAYGPGECFGELSLLDGRPRSAGAKALEAVVLYTLSRDDFLRCVKDHPSMALSILEMLAARIRYTTTYAEGLVFLNVSGRVAAKLLELAERYGAVSGNAPIDLNLTQTDLANWVAASRESTNRALVSFRERHLIRWEGTRITILDRRGLEREAHP